jgi:hypothetical protein
VQLRADASAGEGRGSARTRAGPAAVEALMRWWRARWHCMKARLVARLPLAAIEPLAVCGSFVHSLCDARVRWVGLERWETGREVLGLTLEGSACRMSLDKRAVLSGKRLEMLLDQRLHFGCQLRGREAWPDLQAVAADLAQRIAIHRSGTHPRPVILAPFHYVSQYANIYVIDELRARLALESIGVVSGVPRNLYGDDGALIPHIDVLHTYSEDNRNSLGLRVLRSLRRNGVVVLFADVPPYTLARFPMETVGVSMFGRPARVHNGVFRLGAPVDALLLPFYLRFERGRFGARIFEPVPLAAHDAPQRLAQCIERALIDNFARSLITGHPSLYAFSPAR